MPTVVMPQILVDDDDPKSAVATICRVLSLAAALQVNRIIGYDFPTEPARVEVEAHQLDEMRAGLLTDLIAGARRH